MVVACKKGDQQLNPKVNTQTSASAHTTLAADSLPDELSEEDINRYPFLASITNTQQLSPNVNLGNSFPMKVRLRWDHCYRPLGICLFGFSLTQPYDLIDVYVLQNKLIVFPSKETAFSDDTVPITADIILDGQTSQTLGHSSIRVLKGRYKLHRERDSNNHQHGYVILNTDITQ